MLRAVLLPTAVLGLTTNVNQQAKHALAASESTHADNAATVHADQASEMLVTCFVCQGAWPSGQPLCTDTTYSCWPETSVNFSFAATTNQNIWPMCQTQADQRNIPYNSTSCISYVRAFPPPPAPPAPPAPPPSTSPVADSSCFSAATATTCRLLAPTGSPEAAYESCYAAAGRARKQLAAERVMLASLNAGDRVLTANAESGALAITHVLVNQHASAADGDEPASSPLLRLHTSDGAVLTLTPDHALYVDGALAAVRDVVVGSVLTTSHATATIVTRITPLPRGSVVNPTTASGTILVSDHGAPLLAASHPIWIAPLLLSSPTMRIVANVALSLAGDRASAASAAAAVLAKICSTIVLLGFAGKAVARRKSSISA